MFYEKIKRSERIMERSYRTYGYDSCDVYCAVDTYAQLTKEELLENPDDAPVVTLLVEKYWLERWVQSNTSYSDLRDFLDNYIYDTAVGLEQEARFRQALAFAHIPSRKHTFVFPERASQGMIAAYTEYLSAFLDRNGFVEASRAIDDMFLNDSMETK